MNAKFFENRTNQLHKGVIQIVFNMCACSDGILLSNSNFLFAKTPELKQTDLLQRSRLLRRCAPRNDKRCISVSLRAIRRIARQSQPSLWDFFNRPFRGNDSVAQELIPIGVREYYECQIF